jgi:hypothetical protein
MKRSKLLSVLIPLIVGIFILSFASTVYAKNDTSKVTTYPLDPYWTTNNPSVFYWWAGPEPGGEQWYIIFFGGASPDEYDGYIKERVLPDGRAEITVYLTYQDYVIPYFETLPGWIPIFEPGSLTMSGKDVLKFIIDEPIDEPADVPFLLFLEPKDIVFQSITANGFGIFSDDAEPFGFKPGATGKVTVVQRNLYPPNPPPQLTDPYGYGMWPVTFINVQEVS